PDAPTLPLTASFFSALLLLPPSSTLFPYTTLFRSRFSTTCQKTSRANSHHRYTTTRRKRYCMRSEERRRDACAGAGISGWRSIVGVTPMVAGISTVSLEADVEGGVFKSCIGNFQIP